MVLLLKCACNFVDTYSRLLIIGFVLLTLPICVIRPVVAQTPETSSSTTAPGLPSIQITTPQDGQQVPPGELTIQGISSDDEETECQVYADLNDVTPMRNVTATEEKDFSKWTFKYNQDYQLIKQGENELTAKISCADSGSNSPISEWDTVNVTAVQGASAVPLPSPSPSNTEEAGEETRDDTGGDASSNDGSTDDNTDDEGGNSNNGLFGGDSFFD